MLEAAVFLMIKYVKIYMAIMLVQISQVDVSVLTDTFCLETSVFQMINIVEIYTVLMLQVIFLVAVNVIQDIY